MSTMITGRPGPNDYASYYEQYISLVPEGDILTTLGQQADSTLSMLRGIPEARADWRYSPGKWSIKEVFGHVIDAERIFAYRALRFARNDRTPVPGFEQDDYVSYGNFGGRSLSDLAGEYEHVRRASIFLLRGLSGEAWDRRGLANDNEVSVRALAYIMAGHERHHLEVIRTKYL